MPKFHFSLHTVTGTTGIMDRENVPLLTPFLKTLYFTWLSRAAWSPGAEAGHATGAFNI